MAYADFNATSAHGYPFMLQWKDLNLWRTV